MEKGLIFDFHRGTVHDGPGMRTTVFFKGCPLQCEWCHNPESIKPNEELQYDKNKCIWCLVCIDTCKKEALESTESGIKINRSKCNRCFLCVKKCPSKALNKVGSYWDTEELVNEALKDQMFFKDFSGGITVSGGEPILQHAFLYDFLVALKEKNIDIALDTSGFGRREIFEKIYPLVDTFLYDIKFIDEKEHIKFTGVSNKTIISNLKYIANNIRKDRCKKIWIRTPLIPSATATHKNIDEIGTFIEKELLDVIDRWELCAFNNVCKEKYIKMNKKWKYEQTTLLTEKEVSSLKSIAEKYARDLVIVSGLTKQ